MVLVDLPGMIQHHTLGMNADTKDSIYKMCRTHIENPHSIILCVQDATRDAEGSGFADIVREVDPKGDRTIFVLTKVICICSAFFPLAVSAFSVAGSRWFGEYVRYQLRLIKYQPLNSAAHRLHSTPQHNT